MSESKRIVFLSHTARSSPFRVGSHHLSRELAALGHRVAHVSNPIALAHVAQLRNPEIRSRARASWPRSGRTIDGVRHVVPWSVLPLGVLPTTLGNLGSVRALRRGLNDAGVADPDLVLVDQPMLHYLIEPLTPARVVYRPTDIVTSTSALRAQDVVLARADGVVATSQTVLDDMRRRSALGFSGVVANGVEYDRFATHDVSWQQRAGAVYIGALDDRFDWEAVRRMAGAGVPIDLYGPRPAQLPTLPASVRFRGPIEYTDVPQVLAQHRVGLLPLTPIPVNTGRSPMKLYEYLAAGLNVVSLRTPALQSSLVPGLFEYSEATHAEAALTAASATPPPQEARAAAQAMDWSVRAKLLLADCV